MPDKWKELWETPLDRTSSLVEQIILRCLEAMNKGYLQQGKKVPPLRKLSEKLAVSLGTVKGAYLKLRCEGYFTPRGHLGTYVSQIPGGNSPLRLEWTDSVPFSFREDRSTYATCYEMGHNSFLKIGTDSPGPERLNLKKYLNFLQASLDPPKRYSVGTKRENEDPEEMLDEFLGGHLKERGIETRQGQRLLLPAGTALALVAKALLSPGDCVVVASLLDIPAREAFLGIPVGLKPAGYDREGILTSKVEQICQEQNVKAVFVRPPAAFPQNVTMSEKRRDELVELAHRYKFALIAQDDVCEFWFSHPFIPLGSKRHQGRAIHISRLSSLAAAIDSYEVITAADPFVHRIYKKVKALGLSVNPVKALVLIRFLNGLGNETYARKFIKLYAARLTAIQHSFDEHLSAKACIVIPRAGLSLWICFEKAVRADLLLSLIRDSGFSDYNSGQSIVVDGSVTALHAGFARHGEECWESLFEGLAELL
ncbi:GntR family transcriptional regulator [Arcticibacter tournemirensis]|uniref:GntR family transcriptional regulator n=1 Tax=Arcticibacter tournemirensis TaxID=699437 RepID=A0A4V1KI41_9SPHI|nr:GntR family transcriptional regulator [Arcticibacter tournemirensis]RXF69372.1 GntR family transcriptional regulator [Arcticibacter tournemirensis]